MKNLYQYYRDLINDGIYDRLPKTQKESFLDTMRIEMKEKMFGDRGYFVKNGYIVEIEDTPDLFFSYNRIRKATNDEIAFEDLYWKLKRQL